MVMFSFLKIDETSPCNVFVKFFAARVSRIRVYSSFDLGLVETVIDIILVFPFV